MKSLSSQVKLASQASQVALRSVSTTASAESRADGKKSDNLVTASRLAAMKKGPGYRSSFSGLVATVFGSSGQIGRSVCNRLGKNGTQMILPYRGDHYPMMRLKVCGDLGQVLFTPYNLRDEESIRKSMMYSNVVINLVGKAWPTRNFSLRDVNSDGAGRLARIAREMGVERFIHVSEINAREKPNTVFTRSGSEYLKTKWEGEQRVLSEFPDATILRSTDVYGNQDSFITYYMAKGRHSIFGEKMPLWAKGEETVKAPIHFSDIGKAILAAIDDPASKGRLYELYGPEFFTLADLVDWMHLMANKDPYEWGYKRTDLRFTITPWIRSLLCQSLPIGTQFFGGLTIDKLERTSLSDEVLGIYPTFADLDITPGKIKDCMPFELDPYDAMAHYTSTPAEKIHYNPPTPLNRFEVKNLVEAQNQSFLPV